MMLEPDSIYTLSSVTTARKGGANSAIPKQAPFPLPYSDDFERRAPPSFPKYFSDNGGSFEIAAETTYGSIVSSSTLPASSSAVSSTSSPATSSVTNQYLLQAVRSPPIKNRWVTDVEPITVLGENTTAWGDKIRVDVKIRLPQSRDGGTLQKYAGACLHTQGGGQEMLYSGFRGHCMLVVLTPPTTPSSTTSASQDGLLSWALTEGNSTLLTGRIQTENSTNSSAIEDGWHSIGVSFRDPVLSGWLGGYQIGTVNITNSKLKLGRVALVSGWHTAHFDDFVVKPEV